MPVLGLSAAAFTTAATAATVTTATTAAASAAATAAMTATLTTIATKVAINLAISTALSLLQPNVGAAGRSFEWTLDPDGPIPFAAGRVGVPGSVVYRRTFGPDLMYYGIPSVLSGSGPIDGFEGFMADDEAVTFDATGKAISSQYKGELWYRNSLGRQPDTALVSPSGLKNNVSLIGWTAANRLSGKASYIIVMGENSKGTAYPTGEIKPIVTFRGLKGWDPRLDSTYPGGMGACRLHDPATWVYITNPILWALKWSLGLWEGPAGKGAPQVDYQVGGIGAKLSGIDVPAFISAANVADANGWTVAAYPTTDDDKAQVLDAFLQAGGAIYAQRAGKISCIQRAAPRASIVTISAADTAGPLEIDTAASRIDRINTIRPRFWSEAHRWQMTALPEVTAAAYQADDGGKRTRGLDLHYVSDAKQAAQLAALQIANTREGIAGVIPLKPHLQRIRPGDAFTITEAGFVLNGLKCLCLNTDYDPSTGVVRVSFVSETDQKYPFALGQSPIPPSPPVLTPVDNSVSPPHPDDWVVTPRPPGVGGSLVPGFDLSGVVGNSTATAIEVQWWEVPDDVDPDDEPPEDAKWQSAGTWPPTANDIPINVPGGRYYWIGLIYVRNQNYSARTLYGPYLAGELAAMIAPDAPALGPLKEQIEFNARRLLLGITQSWNRDRDEREYGIAREALMTANVLRTVEVLQIVDADNLVRIETERLTRITELGNETLARQLQVSGLGETLAVVDARSLTVASDLEAFTETATVQISSLGTSLAVVDVRSQTSATELVSLTGTTTGLVASYNGLNSTVIAHSTALSGLELQNNIARFDLEVAAGGGQPARFSLISGSTGTAAAIMADSLWIGENIFFDTASRTLQTLAPGGMRRVIGAGFGVDNALDEWRGPANVAVSTMTVANSAWAVRAADGKTYYGASELGSGGSGRSLVNVSDRTVSGWTLMADRTISGVSAGPNGVVVSADFIIGTLLFMPVGPGVTEFIGEVQLREMKADGTGVANLGSRTFTDSNPVTTIVATGTRSGQVRYQLYMRSYLVSESATVGGNVDFQAGPNA